LVVLTLGKGVAMRFIFLAITISWLAGYAIQVQAEASFKKDEEKINAYVEDEKYLTAAEYIVNRTDLLGQPEFVRQLTHILTTKYIAAINYSLFSLKDLDKGERIEDYRGKSGMSTMVGGQLDELLYQRIKKNPNSPEINFAVGEYLSRGDACGCRSPGPLKDLSGDDAAYFLKAYKGGVADDWSLFRIGMHYQVEGKLDDAIAFYKKSLAINPDGVDANYDLASVYFVKKDDRKALGYIEKVLGKYNDPELDADTYALHGSILVALGNDRDAEKSLQQALKLKSWHEDAFKELLQLYRRTGQDDKYIAEAGNFIALDYGNTQTFNTYIDYLQRVGQSDLDRKVEKHLLALKLTDARQNGALYFNLGRMADMRSDEGEAIKRYKRSLAEMKTLKNPPEGAIPALMQRIQGH
jgi:tetratricopeptide (TPR) repeat protein